MNLVPWIVEILTVTLLVSTKTTTATTKRQVCANGQLTLHCEAIRDGNAVQDVQWKIKFPGTEWIKFSKCNNKSVLECKTERSILAEGINLVNNSNGAVTIERSAGSNTYDHARILCVVQNFDGSVNSHTYEMNFTAHCVWIQEGRDLNLTRILLNLRLPCKRVVDIDWMGVNGSKFAYCNTCQTCTITNNNYDNRLQVVRGALMLTGIRKDDDESEVKVKVHTNTTNIMMESFHPYTVWIFVTSGRDTPEPTTKPASTLMIPTSRTDIGTARSSLPSFKPSYPDDVVFTPSTTAKRHSGSPTRNGSSAAAAASAVSSTRGELWTAVVIAVAVFLFICLR